MTDGTSTAVWLAENGIGAPVDYYAYGGLLARRKAEQAERVARRGRPFGRGAAVRSDGGDVPCADCLAMGATPEESFLIHSDPQPVPVPDDGERSARPGREITRIVEGGRMGQESDLNGRLI